MIYNDIEARQEIYKSLSKREKTYISGEIELQEFPYISRFLLYEDSEPIGFVEAFSYDGISRTSASLIIAVKSEYRRKHYAQILVKKCIESLKKKGYKRLIYNANIHNISSQKLAESLQFKLIKQWKNPTELYYYKKLGEV